MEKLTKIQIIPLAIMAMIMILSGSCKKTDDTSSPSSSKKDPVITWANPADISVGTSLSATQLNATADVPGTFVYTPPIGTKLNEGANQNLKADFTPTDEATYNAASKTVKINVTSASGSGGVSNAVFNPNLTYGNMTDIDGNVYKTIKIGTQTWMAENLRSTKYRNGDSIPNVTLNSLWDDLYKTATGAYCNIANTTDKNEIATFGRLYNFFAVKDSRNIAPVGWHVATEAEWMILQTYLGGQYVAGGKIKETGTTHWKAPNEYATNETGFTALPGGSRDSWGTFSDSDYWGYWWTSSEYDESYSWYCRILHSSPQLECNRYNIKEYGYSVRCVKD